MVTLSVLLVSYYCLHIFTNFQIRASFTALKLLFQYWAGIKLCAFIFVSNHISATLFISFLCNSLIITVTLHKLRLNKLLLFLLNHLKMLQCLHNCTFFIFWALWLPAIFFISSYVALVSADVISTSSSSIVTLI